MELISFGIVGAVVGAISLFGYIEVRRAGRRAQFIESLRQYDPLYLSDRWTTVNYSLEIIGQESSKWQRSTLLITHKRIAIYPYIPDDFDKVKALYTIQPHELQGFWRPIKYMAGENELWIHAQIDEVWQILKLKLYQYDMHVLIRAMKEISTEEQVKAYRRQRPYIHRDTTPAFPAKQTLTGEWELGGQVQLYLMPLYLVILSNFRVQERYALTQIQDIAALKRMEGGKPDGLIRFFMDNELRAFALDDYEAWAEALAEASKRTLEEPVMRKRKSKDDDDLDDWDDE
jgi:hypothetical protein